MSRSGLREKLPIAITALVLVVLYVAAGMKFENFVSMRVFANLLADNAFLGVVAVGLTFGASGTFLAQMFLRQPLIRAATQEFHIDGTWSDPRVTRVDRRAAAESRADPASEARVGRTN